MLASGKGRLDEGYLAPGGRKALVDSRYDRNAVPDVGRTLLADTLRDEPRLPLGRRNVDHELETGGARYIDERVDVRVVLAGFELDDARLRNPKPFGKGPLREIVLGPVANELGGDLTSQREPLPLDSEVRVAVELLREKLAVCL